MTGEHERDVRDPALDAAWRAQSGDAPPPALDAAILAAAHRAVKSAPARIGPGSEATWPWRWWAPLMAAAAIGAVTIGVLQLAPREPDETKAVVSDVPANARAPAAPAPTASPPAPARAAERVASPKPDTPSTAPAQPRAVDKLQDAKPAARTAPEPFPARREAAPSAGASGKADRPALAPAPARAAAAAAAEAPTDNAMRQAIPLAPASPALEKRATRHDATAVRTADEWIARIRSLLERADEAGAARELAAFRAAYPDADARLPADLRAWAASVPRAPR